MIYILSFIRRLRVKSAFYFSLIPALAVGLCLKSAILGLVTLTSLTLVLYFFAWLINEMGKSNKSGIQCKLCGYGDCNLLYPARKKSKDNESKDLGDYACSSFDHGKYSDIYYCPNCKNGLLKEIGGKGFEEHKNKGLDLYENVVDEEYIKNIEARYLTNSKLVDSYKDYFDNKDVLEVGSYYGAFAHEVSKVTKSYTGLEPSKHACEYLKNKLPHCDVNQGTVDDLIDEDKFGGKRFDTIVLFDVIEHVPNPIETLKVLNQYLKEDGILIFSTINIESTLSIAMGPIWPWYMDMHYYYFSDRGYVDMLHRSGYVMNNHHHYPYYVYFSYFVKKVMSITIGVSKLPAFLEKAWRFPIRIRFGDTVMIVGQKKTL